ncbi:TonB-dependent receptor plug domain-containing protein [Aeromonas allosaccharophila]|uniref:TonB-dependent receptor plug domain-containing protein n=1 Tax=Aeromonas allosaccharophila TaxID=656 RepID=UPI000AA3D028|nr:TonB-dependent receptor plug domain-containing protein [Aeromonas allosaccharophila]
MKFSASRFIAPSLLATTIVTLLTQQAIAASNAPQADEVITVTTTAHNTRSAPASISVITAEQIAAAPVNDLADLLRHEVGIQAEADTNGRSDIGIRGMSGKYTLVLVDGKRLSSSNALWRGGNFDNTPVPLGMIQRVEVIRGPMSHFMAPMPSVASSISSPSSRAKPGKGRQMPTSRLSKARMAAISTEPTWALPAR